MNHLKHFAAAGLIIASMSLMTIGSNPAASPTPQAEPQADAPSDPLIEALDIGPYLMTEEQEASVDEATLIRNQENMSTLLERIGADSFKLEGFAGAVVNPATATVNLWWSGPVPESVEAIVDDPADAVTVVLRQAQYSRLDLMTRIAEVRSEMTGVDLAVPKEDGSGIVVTHTADMMLAAASIEDLVGVPVTSVVDEPWHDAVGGRQADGDPWYGGSLMRRPVGGGLIRICSTGFAVLDGVEGRLLSAAHCDTSGNEAWNNGQGADLTSGGGAVSVALSVDSMLINPVGGTRGRVYVDGVFTTDTRKVAGTDTNNVGELVATSGGNSGDHRGLNIIDDSFPSQCNGFNCTLIVARADPGEVAVADGDSGGAVYHVRDDGRVNAKGIIKAGANDVTCGVTRFDVICYRKVAYVPIRPLLNVWNVQIETID